MRPSLLLLLAVTLPVGAVQAQNPPVPPPPPVAPPAAPAALPPPGAVMTAAPVQLSGTVGRLLINPNGEIDSLLLRDGVQVPVPPPLSATLARALHPGDPVRVAGQRLGNLPVIAQAQVTTAAGDTLVSANPPPPAPPAAPPALLPLSATGTVERPLYGPMGDVTGVLLRDGTVLHLPRPAADQLQGLLQPGATVAAKGFGVQSPLGRAIQVTALGQRSGAEVPVPTPPAPPPPPVTPPVVAPAP